ncbi:MAG: tRNA lysidine(34) synthetase TilS [Planctomycetota bacterium]|nr:tRNA lysidine(34) synthetase TilS [Planctomycetota bacterium]
MQPNSQLRGILRADPSVRRVVASWRRLTCGAPVRDEHRRTLIACSGGADSSALAIALASASSQCVLAHIVHDIRPQAQSHADEASTARLAAALCLPFVCLPIRCAQLRGNLEANARTLRYQALATLAREHGCPFIATGHQADDQLETMLMRLIRGGSLRALAGIRNRRPCHDATLIRPMLHETRADSERICGLAQWTFVDDLTNADTTRTRAKLRHQVLPLLRALRPDASKQASSVAASLAGISIVIDDAIGNLLRTASQSSAGLTFDRNELRALRPAIVAELFAAVHGRECAPHLPQPRRAEILAAVESIRGDTPAPRTLHVGALVVNVAHATVTVSSASNA